LFTDEQGDLLRDVQTRLTPAGTEKHQFQKSNKKGEAIFRDLASGAFELRAQLKDHMPLKWSVQLSRERTLELTLMTQQGFDRMDKEATDEINGREFSKAAATLEKLLKPYPLDAELHDHLARAFAGMGDEEKALAQAKEATQLDPHYSGSLLEVERFILTARGNKALQNQDFPKAAEAFESLVRLAPQDATAYYGLALAYGHQERFQQALPAINRALELDPQIDSYRQAKATLEAHAAGH
jgi:tetratricopeptide (TPR) repeat protein